MDRTIVIIIVIVIITVIVVVCEVIGKEGSLHVIIDVIRQTKQPSIKQPEREKEKVREMQGRNDRLRFKKVDKVGKNSIRLSDRKGCMI